MGVLGATRHAPSLDVTRDLVRRLVRGGGQYGCRYEVYPLDVYEIRVGSGAVVAKFHAPILPTA